MLSFPGAHSSKCQVPVLLRKVPHQLTRLWLRIHLHNQSPISYAWLKVLPCLHCTRSTSRLPPRVLMASHSSSSSLIGHVLSVCDVEWTQYTGSWESPSASSLLFAESW